MTKASNRVLVVDDEQAHTMLLAELLRKAGYTVDSANDGFKAIAACKVRTPDVIILDLHMPLMGGMEVYNRLRSEEKTGNIPIIFLGSKDKALPGFAGEDTSNEDIIFKPFEPNELLARVKSVIREKALREELRKKENQIRELSLTDNLTSLKSVRYLNEFLKLGIKQAKRYGVPLSVVVVEVDNHKELMKQFGQKACDSLVTQMAAVVSRQMRESDITVRTGTYEFTVVLTVTPKEGAIEVAERLRVSVQQATFTAGDQTANITCSVGICQFAKHMDEEGKILISHARTAVTHAHSQGGNVTLMAE